ncbi:carbohydrate kinase family protein [Spirosoma utsteinense]|uniref:Fructokinase n=1 Tax=Spirosoma utsteinense TaxID=2585773 RepID=A0ABR6WEN4_9BACT|nr:carbohydrate kinase [Spirosoma utsteinense]MBC3788803.1 fructokinase [Spirosoma utsteinense]MBC3794397.1 fructokinase [Spirosoma utsteinense]
MNAIITCFGETLWDVLPTSKQPGGAPMNVAADLRNFGINAQMISRVGSDELGTELLDFIAHKGLPLDLIQVGQTHLTGVAKANISDANEVTYKIVQPVAWDYIHLETRMIEAVRLSDFFVYGSLAARSQQTHETLLALLAVAPRKVFDVNLRAPHYNRPLVEELLHEAHIAKLNEHELVELAGWYGEGSDLYAAMNQLRERYTLDVLCVTLGEHGAVLLDETGLHSQTGFPVEVADTIGSGDAFLAGFLYKTLQGESAQRILEFACATGAYVATQRGATPAFSAESISHTILLPALLQ